MPSRTLQGASLVLGACAALVAGCGGSAPRGVTSAGATVPISGRAAFERPLVDPLTATLAAVTTRLPIRLARVEVVAGAAVVAAGATDERGAFALRVPAALAATPLEVRVLARSAVAWAPVAVADHGGALHAASLAGVTSAAPADLVVGPGQAGAFNALDCVLRGVALVRSVEPEARLPALDVVWTPGGPNRAATSFDRERWRLDVLDDPAGDTDCFDDAVLLHELGHALQAAFSGDSTPGGAHLSCAAALPQDLDLRLAFAEGWATAFGQAALGDPRYVDTRPGGGLVVDIERPCARALGPGSESALHGLLWDLLDGGAGPPTSDPDGAALGFAPLWRAMRALRATPHSSVADLREALLAGGALTAAGWDQVGAPLGLAAPLPPLGAPLPPGVRVLGAVDASLGQDSLRAASAYFLVTVPPGAAGLSLALDPTGGDELDLLLDGPDGSRRASRQDGAPERLDVPFPAPGAHLVRVQARGGATGSPRAGFALQAALR